jgi:hypothetical protein
MLNKVASSQKQVANIDFGGRTIQEGGGMSSRDVCSEIGYLLMTDFPNSHSDPSFKALLNVAWSESSLRIPCNPSKVV